MIERFKAKIEITKPLTVEELEKGLHDLAIFMRRNLNEVPGVLTDLNWLRQHRTGRAFQ